MIDTHIHTHHPDIARVLHILSQQSPSFAGRASAALHHLLNGVYESPLPNFAWHASSLTGDGFPLELAFTSADTVLRYTSEVTAPAHPAPTRITEALALISRLGGQIIAPELVRVMRALHASSASGSPLHYGVWVGGRHEEECGMHDHFKFYIEIPASNPLLPMLHSMKTAPIPELSDRFIQLRMFGYEPVSDTHEWYYRVERPMSQHIYHLMDKIGLSDRTRELLNLIETASGRALHDFIPGGSVGFSYAYRPGRPVTFTLYLFARSLWGGDRRILRGLTTLATAQGWHLGAYQQIAAPLMKRDVYQTYHGLLGLVVAPHQPVHVTIGLRPPPSEAAL